MFLPAAAITISCELTFKVKHANIWIICVLFTELFHRPVCVGCFVILDPAC